MRQGAFFSSLDRAITVLKLRFSKSTSGASMFNRPRLFAAASLAALAAGVSLTRPALANERHFTYTYESGVLPPGAREVELWSTYRTGRHEYYTELDHRAE